MVSSVNVAVGLIGAKFIRFVPFATTRSALGARTAVLDLSVHWANNIIIFEAWVAKSLRVIGRYREKADFTNYNNPMKLAA